MSYVRTLPSATTAAPSATHRVPHGGALWRAQGYTQHPARGAGTVQPVICGSVIGTPS